MSILRVIAFQLALVMTIFAACPADAEDGRLPSTTRLLSPNSFSSEPFLPGASSLGFPSKVRKVRYGNQKLPPCATSSCLGLNVVDLPAATVPCGTPLVSAELDAVSGAVDPASVPPPVKYCGANPYRHMMFGRYGYTWAPGTGPESAISPQPLPSALESERTPSSAPTQDSGF